MEEQTKYISHTDPIKAFIENNKALLHGIDGKSALYIRDNCTEIYVIQTRYRNGACFIFEFDCGVLCKMKTECNVMERYMMLIPTSEYVEYIVF